MPKIIQFLHPGGEHSEKSGKIWNPHPPHKRKFVSWNGEYVEKIDSSTKKGNIDFWCEWEAESTLLDSKNRNNKYPRNLFSPYYTHFVKGNKCENTDPFVFGDQFYYSICKQGNKNMRNLENGTLILFGSNINQKFVLDTVFIIKDNIPYRKSNYNHLKESSNGAFFETAILPVVHNNNKDDRYNRCNLDNTDYKVYIAQMKEENSKIFSYVPCVLHSDNWGFERPAITGGFISDRLNQNLRYSREMSIIDIQKYWEKMTESLIKRGFSLMTSCDLPKQS